MLTRRALILAKVEDGYGVCSTTPTASQHAIAVWDLEVKPEAETLDREIYRDSLEPMATVIGRKKVGLSFKAELKSNGNSAVGSAGLMPRVGALLRACGMVMSANAETSSGDADGWLDFTTRSESFESGTIYAYRDGILHQITGARGNCELSVRAGAYGELSFELTGLYATPVDTAVPTAAYETTLPPQAKGVDFLIDSYGPCVDELSVDLGNQINDRVCLNSSEGLAEVLITAREPKGNMNPDAVLEATGSYWASWESGAVHALDFTLGTSAGNQVQVTVPEAQYAEMGYQDADGLLKYNVPFNCTDAGSNGYSVRLRFK